MKRLGEIMFRPAKETTPTETTSTSASTKKKPLDNFDLLAPKNPLQMCIAHTIQNAYDSKYLGIPSSTNAIYKHCPDILANFHHNELNEQHQATVPSASKRS